MEAAQGRGSKLGSSYTRHTSWSDVGARRLQEEEEEEGSKVRGKVATGAAW